MSQSSRRCWIYRCSKQDELYLYLPAPVEQAELPEALHKRLGRLALAMELELSPASQLARVEVAEVLAALDDPGYFLQMPPKVHAQLYFGD